MSAKRSSKECEKPLELLVQTPQGRTTSTSLPSENVSYETLLDSVWDAVVKHQSKSGGAGGGGAAAAGGVVAVNDDNRNIRRRLNAYMVHEGRVLDQDNYHLLLKHSQKQINTIQLRLRLKGGMDRQNRVGSKFGGGGVSSSQNAERERKERLKRLALESIDLAKDPYLIKSHHGTYECKLCLTLHTNEANYLAHTQGKKHQQGLARRAFLEKKKAEQDAALAPIQPPVSRRPTKIRKIRIGRPAYQIYKSRDPDTNQRCLSFELSYPEIENRIQPRYRFMSAFEQKVDTPADRRYQYLLVAAHPYETVGFKIPNEPVDKGEGRFVTHWDAEEKKFILTLYYLDPKEEEKDDNNNEEKGETS